MKFDCTFTVIGVRVFYLRNGYCDVHADEKLKHKMTKKSYNEYGRHGSENFCVQIPLWCLKK
jgi:hypothetical protein